MARVRMLADDLCGIFYIALKDLRADHFPMMFLGGMFVPLSAIPPALRVVARTLPLTDAVEALRAALGGRVSLTTALNLAAWAAFTGVLLWPAVRTLAQHMD